MKKFAVILAGCGVNDGAEIHEAVMTLWAVAKHGGSYTIFAPDINQHHVVNHLTGKEMPEKRNVLVESARIARGKIIPLSRFQARDFDALVLPGGFGVAKNLCNWAFSGPQMEVLPEVSKAIKDMVALKKPVGALCISPVILAKLFPGATVTIGSDPSTIAGIEKMGGVHLSTTHGEVIHDATFNLFTSPCYMLDATILQIADGADNMLAAISRQMAED